MNNTTDGKNSEFLISRYHKKQKNMFSIFAKKLSDFLGHPLTFFIAFFTIMLWLISGYFFDFSDTWQLIINTVTNVVTFLIVFIIQNSQNRNVEVMQIKLDELIRAQKSARNSIINLEKLSDKELREIEKAYEEISGEEE